MELIDKQKLLAQLEQAIESCTTDTIWERGYRTAIQETIDEINDGAFNDHSTQEQLAYYQEREFNHFPGIIFELETRAMSAEEEIAKLQMEIRVTKEYAEQLEKDNAHAEFNIQAAEARAIQAESVKRDLMASLLKGDRLISGLREDLEQAEQERDELLEGLKWYADDRNWGSIEDLGAMVSDGGDHARSIIAKIEGK